jgi:hypothetical protein
LSLRGASTTGLEPAIAASTVRCPSHWATWTKSGRWASNPLLRFGRPACPPSSPRPRKKSAHCGVVNDRMKRTGGRNRTLGQTDLEAVPLPQLADKRISAQQTKKAALLGYPDGRLPGVTSLMSRWGALSVRPRLILPGGINASPAHDDGGDTIAVPRRSFAHSASHHFSSIRSDGINDDRSLARRQRYLSKEKFTETSH